MNENQEKRGWELRINKDSRQQRRKLGTERKWHFLDSRKWGNKGNKKYFCDLAEKNIEIELSRGGE